MKCLAIQFIFLILINSSNLWANNEIEVFVQKGHGNSISSFDVSNDGKYIVTSGIDESIILWDYKTARMIKQIRESREYSPHTPIVFSTDNTHFASANVHGVITIWSVINYKEVHTYQANSISISSIAFSPKNKFLASFGNDHIITVWDIATRSKFNKFEMQSNYNGVIAFSPCESLLAAAGDNKCNIYIWNVKTGNLLKQLKGHKQRVNHLEFSHDGRFILSNSDKKIILWNVEKEEKTQLFSSVFGFFFRNSSRHCWDSTFLSSDSDIVAASINNKIRFVNIKNKKILHEINFNSAQKIKFANNKDVIVGDDNRIIVLDYNTGKVKRSFSGFTSEVNDVSYSPNGKLAASSNSFGLIQIWDMQTGKGIRLLDKEQNNYSISSVKFSNDSRMIASSICDGSVVFWDIKTGKINSTYKVIENYGVDIDLSFEANKLAVATSESVEVWNIILNKKLMSFKRQDQKYCPFNHNSILFLEDDILLFPSTDSCLLLSYYPNNIEMRKFNKHIKMWSISKNAPIHLFIPKKILANIRPIAVSKDHSYLVGGGYSNIFVWEIGSDKNLISFNSQEVAPSVSFEKNVLTGHTKDINDIKFLNNSNKLVISCSEDKSVKLWDIANSKNIRTFKGFPGAINGISISPDDKYFFSGCRDGSSTLWDLKSGKKICDFFFFNNTEWVVITPEGFFNASSNGAKFVNVRINNLVSTIDQFYDTLYRPDLVYEKIKGDIEGLVASAASNLNLRMLISKGPAPKVTIFSPQSGISDVRDINIKATILDLGGGIGKIIWKLNNQTISVEEKNRAIKVSSSTITNSTLAIQKLLTLSPGENTIEIIAYNEAECMSSTPETLIIDLHDSISEQPDLNILSVAINKYRDKSLWLNYAVPDAIEIVKSLKKIGKGIFSSINITEIYDENATLPELSKAFHSISEKDKTNDLFVFYVAGHGLTLDGRYHFLPVDFRYHNADSVRHNAINQNHFQKWLAKLNSRKSLILLDTCNSGSFVNAQLISRGIAEKTAIDKLTRATGRATIASSTESQVAYEGYKGHGVFTYSLLQAFVYSDIKNGNRDGVVSTSEIASFVNEQVPEITYKKWGYEQIPQVNLHGREFPVGILE